MLPRTHHLFIEEAVRQLGPWAQRVCPDLLRGNDDEDVLIVPYMRWRLRAAGLTHTHSPGGRFGELGFPSAKQQCERFVMSALGEKNIRRAAWWMGRACHVLGDAAVPARARRVWHIEGDPLETWIEAHVDSFRGAGAAKDNDAPPGELVERLAGIASTFAADTTRTPWGRAAFRFLHRGRIVAETEASEQARILVPIAIEQTMHLLAWFERNGTCFS